MVIKNEIVYFDDKSGTIAVRYYTDDFPEGFVYNIDLPISDNQYPDVSQINDLITLYEPTSQITRISLLKNATPPDFLKTFAPSDSIISVDKASLLRNQRNIALTESDYTQLPDVPFTDLEKEAWAIYRQSLRDLTEQEGFPDDVIFPVPPNQEPR